MVNLDCQFSLDAESIKFGTSMRQSLSVRRMIEFGAHHSLYRTLSSVSLAELGASDNLALDARLKTSSQVLDVSPFQRKKLDDLGLATIGNVLEADEKTFTRAHYVGRVRARQMQNAAVAAVLEYLSG